MAQPDASYVYRYFTADLLSNTLLAEVPFKGVTYERALKGAGAFSGSIGVSPETDGLNIYNSTLPGKTALYVVRNNECVWGGIIWSRNYDVVSKKLSVSASEFTSLLYHKRVWRTWTNTFTADLSVASGVITATVNDGMTFVLNEESSVNIIMSDVSDFGFNGYYQLTQDSTINESTQIATITMSATSITTPTRASVVMPDGVYLGVTLDVRANTYDYVRSLIDAVSKDFNGTNFPNDEIEPSKATVQRVASRGVTDGIATIQMTDAVDMIPGQEFRVTNVGPNFDGYQIVESVSGGTVTFESGGGSIAFAATNSVSFRATARELLGGTAFITTNAPHGMYVGQMVTLTGFDNPLSGSSLYDGTVRVTSIPSSTTFTYDTGTKIKESSVSLNPATVTTSSLQNKTITGASATGSAVTYTSSSHGFKVGQYVSVSSVSPSSFDVDKGRISAVSTNTFTVLSAVPASVTYVSGGSATAYALVYATKATQDVASIATTEDHGFGAVGSVISVDIAGLTDSVTVLARGLVANVATLSTAETHGFSIGNPVTVRGISDIAAITTGGMAISGNTATLTVDLRTGHGLQVGNTVSVSGTSDVYSVTGYNYTFATSALEFTTSATHNIGTGDKVVIKDLARRSVVCTQVRRLNKLVTLTAPVNHNVKANEKIFVSGYRGTKTLTATKISKLGKASKAPISNFSLVQITFSARHGIKAGIYLTTGWTSPIGPSGIFKNGRFRVTRVISDFALEYDDGLDLSGSSATVNNPGTASLEYSFGINGWWTVSAVTSTSIRFLSDLDEDIALTTDQTTVTVPDATEGEYTVTGAASNTFAVSSTAYTVDRTRTGLSGTATVANGIFAATNANVVAIRSATSFSYEKDTAVATNLRANVTTKTMTGNAVVLSQIFNVTDVPITRTTARTFSFALPTPIAKTVENALAIPNGIASSGSAFAGTGVTATVSAGAGIQYNKLGTGTRKTTRVFGSAIGTSEPEIKYGTYGGYTYNSDILFGFSTAGYSTTQTLPINFRGYEARSVGEELDKYSDIVNGFEYRVDCSYDPNTDTFARTFVLLPILPQSLSQYLSTLPGGVLYLGEAAPASAFGADRLVFQFPGNISDLTVDESAENSATRFFMIGNIGDLGDDASQPYAVAVAKDLLYPTTGDMSPWPILDDTHSDQDLYDEEVLYNYAQRYLAEARPPDAKITVSVNGAITPGVGSYSPGDWCTLIIDDEFIRQRLGSDLEPRGDVIIRKIEGLSVAVPDGATYPEKISLTLIPEWQADQVGK